jgi:hypothetical protein
MTKLTQWAPAAFQVVGAILLPVGVVRLARRVTLVRKASPLLGKILPPESSRDGAILPVFTTLAVVSSFSARVRALPGTQYLGQYLLLIFFSAIGATSNLGKLITASPLIFRYDFIAMFGAIFIHLTLCVIFRIDRDTAIITSTATIFSPPFPPPVAMALKNKEILVSGIASGLVGYAVANYAGVALTWLLSRVQGQAPVPARSLAPGASIQPGGGRRKMARLSGRNRGVAERTFT